MGNLLIIKQKWVEKGFPPTFVVQVHLLPYLCHRKQEKTINDMMTRKQQLKTIAMLFPIVGIALLSACTKRELILAERLAMEHPDSAAAYLATIDTTHLKENERALYTLTRGLVLEEKWQRAHADTAVCLSDNEETWEFKRETKQSKGQVDEELDSMMADSSLLCAYYYYKEKSMGGVTDDEEDLRRFGRICYVLSRHYQDNDTLLQADQLFLLAIHCAEACGDNETAYRAYHLWGRHLLYVHGFANTHETYWCLQQALKHFDRCRNNAQWLLTLMNDYGWVYLALLPLNPRNFPTLVHAANIACQGGDRAEIMYDSVAALIDSVENTPMLPFDTHTQFTSIYDGTTTVREQGVPKGLFMDAEQTYEEEVKNGTARSSVKKVQEKFEADRQRAISHLNVQTSTYLAAGYARKAAMLQSRLLWAVIGCLVLAVLVLLLVFWNWRGRAQRRHQAERMAQEQKMVQLSAQLQQKETLIASLRGHIIDKSEILEMLEPTAGKRTIINARNWQEMEATLDMADNQFVSRLRAEHPTFSEDDIRLCMLTRLKLSNAALSAIYAISVSAVQHRKQKLKKEGFGVSDPMVTLEQVIENYQLIPTSSL